MKAYKGSRGIGPLILIHSIGGGVEPRAGLDVLEKRKIFGLAGNRIEGCPVHDLVTIPTELSWLTQLVINHTDSPAVSHLYYIQKELRAS
jgi:hypothetical protein